MTASAWKLSITPRKVNFHVHNSFHLKKKSTPSPTHTPTLWKLSKGLWTWRREKPPWFFFSLSPFMFKLSSSTADQWTHETKIALAALPTLRYANAKKLLKKSLFFGGSFLIYFSFAFIAFISAPANKIYNTFNAKNKWFNLNSSLLVTYSAFRIIEKVLQAGTRLIQCLL